MLGGDLNFIVVASKVWGKKVQLDPLGDFFNYIFEHEGLVDIVNGPRRPAWKNLRSGHDAISKRLDHCLIYIENETHKKTLTTSIQ